MMKSGMNRDCCDCISFLVLTGDFIFMSFFLKYFQTFSCLSTLKCYELVS
ncbi:unnamed protein product [Brassica rapa]|uniref:Uncharacterized protein n=1 Tax=Brassica campestris TaxID=3711 RepID=A0A3P6CEP1_BRACM|nr:unnamed protein product [Brassica rapa]VDD11474.1 unnamed protein product [Brassica rapa]